MRYIGAIIAFIYLGLAVYLIFFSDGIEMLSEKRKNMLAAIFAAYALFRLFRWWQTRKNVTNESNS